MIMRKGILGQKIGMTSMFANDGKKIPVTIIKVESNIVTKVNSMESDGYKSLQLSVFDKKKKKFNKPEIGHFKKSNTTPKFFVKEIKNMDNFSLGDKVNVNIFNEGELVDVSGVTKGKGFAGNIKRHNQSIGPKSHGGGGGSKPVRQVGSLGDMVSNRVFKGMTMPGQMGNVNRTMQNLEVILVNPKDNFILVKGSIPGPKKGFVIIKSAIKGLPNREKFDLLDVSLADKKNELLIESKKLGVNLDSSMSLDEMNEKIKLAKEEASIENKNKEETKVEPASTENKDKEEIKVESASTENKDKEEIKAEPASTENKDKEEAKVAPASTENKDKEEIKVAPASTENKDKENKDVKEGDE